MTDRKVSTRLVDGGRYVGKQMLKPVNLIRDANKLRKIKELGRKKQAKLVAENRKRQAMYFGQTQYKFLQTTNEHGALIDDDELDYGDEEEE